MSRLEANFYKRIRLVTVLFILLFVAIVTRAFYLQVVESEKWLTLAKRQYYQAIPASAQRGTIYDRNGEPLAVSLDVESIYIEPNQETKQLKTDEVESKRQEAARILATTLNLPYAEMSEKLHSSKSYLWIKRQISPEEAQALRAKVAEAKLPWICFQKEQRRFYPNAQVGAQVIGFTGLDPTGLEGIELKYEKVLKGSGEGTLVSEKDNRGRGIGSSQQKKESDHPGSSLVLTIDKKIQYIAEKELAEGVRSSGAKAGCVIVMDPATGKILAMASQPDFNPNAVARYRPENWRNRALSDAFEPGSTQKVFLVAAALNEKVITPGQLIHCENGSYSVGGKIIHDHSAHGMLSVTEILKYSSNIGSAKIGKRLERERLHRYLSDFGFGSPTGIDLPGESRGMLRKPEKWYEIDLAAISFGQGLTVTPLQTAVAMTAIANNGTLMQPHLVERVIAGDGLEETIEPQVLRQVVSKETARILRDMLMTVTEKGGTGTLAVVPGYHTAGKTGTAQKADATTHGYSADKRVASFVGFIPAEAPKLVILALLDEPQGQVYGGMIAAPIFSRVAAQTLQLLGVPPTFPEDRRNILPSEEAIANLLKSEAMEEGSTGFDMSPVVEVDENGEALVPPPSGPLMPNFIGMSSRQVLEASQKNGLNVKLVGSGRVIEQDPIAGMPIPLEQEIWVRLEPPSDRPIPSLTSAL